MAAKIRKGDKVVVLTGRDKGRSGEVIEVRPGQDRALVRGVNMVKQPQNHNKHTYLNHNNQNNSIKQNSYHKLKPTSEQKQTLVTTCNRLIPVTPNLHYRQRQRSLHRNQHTQKHYIKPG